MCVVLLTWARWDQGVLTGLSAPPPAQQRVGLCNTSGSGTDLPDGSGDVVKTHGPLPQNASLFMGFAFMMTASSESDRLSNKLSSDEEEGGRSSPPSPPDEDEDDDLVYLF